MVLVLVPAGRDGEGRLSEDEGLWSECAEGEYGSLVTIYQRRLLDELLLERVCKFASCHRILSAVFHCCCIVIQIPAALPRPSSLISMIPPHSTSERTAALAE